MAKKFDGEWYLTNGELEKLFGISRKTLQEVTRTGQFSILDLNKPGRRRVVKVRLPCWRNPTGIRYYKEGDVQRFGEVIGRPVTAKQLASLKK